MNGRCSELASLRALQACLSGKKQSIQAAKERDQKIEHDVVCQI